jgi:hypothetical protein
VIADWFDPANGDAAAAAVARRTSGLLSFQIRPPFSACAGIGSNASAALVAIMPPSAATTRRRRHQIPDKVLPLIPARDD